MNDFAYPGRELDLFAEARNWKSYWALQVRPFLKGDILEVGAGLGSNTPFLDRDGAGRWVCLEPDARLADRLATRLQQATRAQEYEAICGTLRSVAGQQFDTILYIDVLEHIENDADELKIAASCLRPAGHLVVLSPAHQRLFSPFDKAIGHFRRYDRSTLQGLTPPGLQLERLRYLDSAGLIASVANLVLLRQSTPSRGQLSVWDRWMVPVSRVLDRLLAYSVGKSIVAVWQKRPAGDRRA